MQTPLQYICYYHHHHHLHCNHHNDHHHHHYHHHYPHYHHPILLEHSLPDHKTHYFYRSERRSKRRVYHTLDLSDESEEDEDFLGKPEEDWLVKRASKEGITL